MLVIRKEIKHNKMKREHVKKSVIITGQEALTWQLIQRLNSTTVLVFAVATRGIACNNNNKKNHVRS